MVHQALISPDAHFMRELQETGCSAVEKIRSISLGARKRGGRRPFGIFLVGNNVIEPG